MNKTGSATKVKLNSFDDLFGIEQPQSGIEQVQEIALTELHGFKEHPFKVLDDEKMQEMIESIREYGVLMPGIARPMKGGGYEIIAGHRRKYACEMVGLSTMPMFIRDYTDDEATIIMVDSNIQREDILPSEKSKAYRMKYDAMKHQGSKAGGLTLGELGEAAGESAKTVQSSMLKESYKKGELTFPMVRMVLEKVKTVERKVVIKAERINSYFPVTYSRKEIENIIYQLLDNWKNNQ